MKNLKIGRIVAGLASVIVLLFAADAAQAQPTLSEVTTTYAAKFICGVQSEGGIGFQPDAQAGRYATKINVHNNTGFVIRFRKKIIRLRGGQSPTDPMFKIDEALKPDQAMEVVCRDIYEHLKIPLNNQQPPPYIEGFLIFEVFFTKLKMPNPLPLDPLDVAGIYTYRGDIPNMPGASGASIDLVVYPAKNNRHALQ
jgi:hypothetical protein